MGQRRATAETTTAATQFLASLTPEQREKANLKFDDANRFDWHYVPRPGQRKGLPLKEMTPAQRQAAQKLLATALSAKGMKQSGQIMNDLELVLRGDGPNPDDGPGSGDVLLHGVRHAGRQDRVGLARRRTPSLAEFHDRQRDVHLVDARFLRRESRPRSCRAREKGCACSRPKKTRRSRCCARSMRSRSRPRCFRTKCRAT